MKFSGDIPKIRSVLRNSVASFKNPEDYTVFHRKWMPPAGARGIVVWFTSSVLIRKSHHHQENVFAADSTTGLSKI